MAPRGTAACFQLQRSLERGSRVKADAAPVRTVRKGSRHPTLLRIRAEDFHRHKVLNACSSHIYDIDAYVYLGLSHFPIQGCVKCRRPTAGKVKLTDKTGSSYEPCVAKGAYLCCYIVTPRQRLSDFISCLDTAADASSKEFGFQVVKESALSRVMRTPTSRSAKSGTGLKSD